MCPSPLTPRFQHDVCLFPGRGPWKISRPLPIACFTQKGCFGYPAPEEITVTEITTVETRSRGGGEGVRMVARERLE